MKKCPLCGFTPVAEHLNFCYADGERLITVEGPVCECGRKLDAMDRFCEMCGRKRTLAQKAQSLKSVVGA